MATLLQHQKNTGNGNNSNVIKKITSNGGGSGGVPGQPNTTTTSNGQNVLLQQPVSGASAQNVSMATASNHQPSTTTTIFITEHTSTSLQTHHSLLNSPPVHQQLSSSKFLLPHEVAGENVVSIQQYQLQTTSNSISSSTSAYQLGTRSINHNNHHNHHSNATTLIHQQHQQQPTNNNNIISNQQPLQNNNINSLKTSSNLMIDQHHQQLITNQSITTTSSVEAASTKQQSSGGMKLSQLPHQQYQDDQAAASLLSGASDLQVKADEINNGTSDSSVIATNGEDTVVPMTDEGRLQQDGGDEDMEAAPEIDIVINNVVCSFSVRCHLNLREIALNGFNVEFKRENGMVTMKLRRPYTTASIWSSGKITCTGATSEDQAKIAARKYSRCLQKLGFRVKFNNFRVVNVLGTCSMPWAIKIVNFSEKYKKDASYEPELHPGVTYKLKTPKATLKIFSTGSITVTAGSVLDVQAAIEHIFPLVYEFRKARVPVVTPAAAAAAAEVRSKALDSKEGVVGKGATAAVANVNDLIEEVEEEEDDIGHIISNDVDDLIEEDDGLSSGDEEHRQRTHSDIKMNNFYNNSNSVRKKGGSTTNKQINNSLGNKYNNNSATTFGRGRPLTAKKLGNGMKRKMHPFGKSNDPHEDIMMVSEDEDEF